MEDKCMKMSASLAYYTTFSIGPLLLILIWLLGFYYGEQIENTTAESKVMEELTQIFGTQTSAQIQSAIENLSVTANSNIGFIIGAATLIFASTTIFVEIQDSINMIWKVKPKPKKSWLKFILNRLTSFSMILGLGFLLIVSLVLNSIIMVLMNYFNEIIPGLSNNSLHNINLAFTFVIISLTFGFIFKLLPDAVVRTKDVAIGAIFTASLFMLGRYGISLYLQTNATASAFGTAGSIIILLLWVYYSSAILYFGAEFTREHARVFGEEIKPAPYAVKISRTEIELDDRKTKTEE